ncbi:4666_t:CDS:2 [Paraglomus occultum]|uniref:4666_t:CDS:1 n=1 Tax=Paraglomus occultum TaxID=144539 RepID=A0A9N8Z527_9GLOM|nr:4666_t:CDS:2 [Paraglomus occultum]
MWKNGTKTQIDNCNDYIVSAPSNLGSFRNYCHTFTTNQTLKYAHPYESEDGVSKIGIYLQIPNVTAAEQSAIGIAALNMLLTTPTFNPLTHPEEVINQMDEDVKSEMTLEWNFLAGMVDYAAVIKFRINEYRAILPRDISAIIGFGANYHVTPIIDNTVTYFPFNTNPYGLANGTNVYFSVAAGSFVQTQETEERTITILSAIASAGGAFGIIGGAYVLFFGQARMDAWGIAHKFSREPAELVGASLFRSPSQDNVFNNDNSQADLNLQIKQLGNDISELKEVIRCYVLDTSYLEEGPSLLESGVVQAAKAKKRSPGLAKMAKSVKMAKMAKRAKAVTRDSEVRSKLPYRGRLETFSAQNGELYGPAAFSREVTFFYAQAQKALLDN